MPFTIQVHEELQVVEVVYPARPTVEEVAEYLHRIREVIQARKGPWRCLVDQRSVQLIAPEVVEHLAAINSFAATHGMERSARLVTGAVASLQVSRMARNADLGDRVRTFHDRDHALAWLAEAALAGAHR